MITISIGLALLVVGAALFVGMLIGILVVALCRSAAKANADYEAARRMFAGADALAVLDEEGA